jgi:hypothetical protein
MRPVEGRREESTGASASATSRSTCSRWLAARACAPRAARNASPSSPSAFASARSSFALKRSGTSPLTTIVSRRRPIARRRRPPRSSVSDTGSSAGSATATYAVRRGSPSHSRTRSDCDAIGPTRAMSAKVCGVRSIPIAWPIAGPSTITMS